MEGGQVKFRPLYARLVCLFFSLGMNGIVSN